MSLEHPATLTPPGRLESIDLSKVEAVQILVRNEKPFDPWDPDVYFQVLVEGDMLSFDFYAGKAACLAFLDALDASSSASHQPPFDREQLALAEKSIDTLIFKLWRRTAPTAI